MKQEFTTQEVMEILGVTKPWLQDGLGRGYFEATKRTGAGKENQWSRWDVYRVAVFKKLCERDFSRMNAFHILDLLYNHNFGDGMLSLSPETTIHVDEVRASYRSLWMTLFRSEKEILWFYAADDPNLPDSKEMFSVATDEGVLDIYCFDILRIIKAVDAKIKALGSDE